MKKFKFISAVVALAFGILMLVGVIPVLMGKESGIYQFFQIYGIGVVAVLMLGIGITQVIKKDLPVSAGFHITLGVIGFLFQLISKFIGSFFMIMMSTLYAILLIIMEAKEMKHQKGFAEKGLAILIAIFAIVYASCYLVIIMFAKVLPNNIENLIFTLCISILPAFLVAKGVVDIVRSFKPVKQEPVLEKAEEPVVEKAEEPAEEAK